ncbi:MAG: HAD-IA family hydrolase [Cellvibrionales bacterium]|nr:HAD-IA family hydrolase [Cellvibrionales bacterium]
MANQSQRQAVLFDLDGTLIDTAPDFAQSINAIRQRYALPPMSLTEIGFHVSGGAAAMIQCAFPDDCPLSQDEKIQELLILCEQNVATQAKPYPGIKNLLNLLEAHDIAYGVVTNRNRRFTTPLLTKLDIQPTNNCVICPEDVTTPKPDPEGIHLALKTLGVSTSNCLYAGDHHRDMEAANNAGVFSLACGFGYITEEDPIDTWQANQIADTVDALTDAIKEYFNV